MNLEPVSYNFANSNIESIGLIAEQVYQYYPELVHLDSNGLPYSVNYELLSVLLLHLLQTTPGIVN
jgi:hypothetical protein